MKILWGETSPHKVTEPYMDKMAEFYIQYMIDNNLERYVFVNSGDGALYISRQSGFFEVWDLRIQRMAVVRT